MTTDLHSLLAPYVLDALEPAERAQFEAHLVQCPDCRSELGGLQATATRLGESQSQEPPAALRQRLLAAIGSIPQERPLVTSINQRRGLRQRLPQLVAAAALVLAAAGGGGYLVERDHAQDRERQLADITSVLGAADAATTAQDFPNGGTVRLVTSKKRDAAVVVAHSLPALDGGKVYQVWLIRSSKAESQGTFSRSGEMVMKDLSSADELAVTVEPSGGSDQPTTAPVLNVPV
ncbi:anti-sigma factor [Aeromicrobium ginsengisoli]|uniref:Regulator of SigK n=1 Tax=Aeromicrobium ginsengisoli TaxID=363867 RepID=A0A5M4FFW6_9ACTN|nr:anti-sigma factor [Aeromicrobium ginsengisoli]KAA1398277.1 anti-sigma factor [Aeromicrobium ginsengisoli]